ncbi:anti-sigma factor [Streptomyces sp. NPDC055254]
MNTENPHEATAAYVLDALPAAERAAFEAHLETCPGCAREVRDFVATAAVLGAAAAVDPPPELRDAVLRRIRTAAPPAGAPDRTEHPGGSARPARPTLPEDREGAPARPARPTLPGDRVDGRTAGGGGPGAVPQRAPAGNRWPRWTLAACLAAVTGLGGIAAWQYQRADAARQDALRAEARAHALTEVLAAPDARPATGRLDDGGAATVVVSRSRDRAVFVPAGVPAPPPGRVYQLWFADPAGTMRPAGVMDPARPDAPALMAGPVRGATAVGVTLEPAGGSPAPTSEPLMVLALPARGAA